MGWLVDRIGSWAAKSHRKDVTAFTNNLAVMDGFEVGMVVACANHQRLLFMDFKGWDLRYPALLADNADVTLMLGGVIKDLQAQGKQSLAAGVMVWLHTVRSMQMLELRQGGRNLWTQLERGFPHVDAAATAFFNLTGYRFNTEGSGEFPDGLTPNPM